MIKVEYIQHVGDSLAVVNAARYSFGDESQVLEERDKKLIKYLADHQHMSPFEHLSLTVKIEVPLYIRSQIMRHRTGAYNELSRRYTDKDMEFFVPDSYRTQHKSNRQASAEDLEASKQIYWLIKVDQHNKRALELYKEMLADGICKEQSRGVLPQDLMTQFIATFNLRNWAHFVKLREHEGAQVEVQLVAQKVKAILIDKFGYAAEALLEEE